LDVDRIEAKAILVDHPVDAVITTALRDPVARLLDVAANPILTRRSTTRSSKNSHGSDSD
jgi:hypothetical protein